MDLVKVSKHVLIVKCKDKARNLFQGTFNLFGLIRFLIFEY